MQHHPHIGTEHILLGLIHEGQGVAARVLEQQPGVSLESVRKLVDDITAPGGRSEPAGYIPFTPRCKKALEFSLREALALNHNYIGTEHILLGLIREPECVAAQILVALGVDLAALRQDVLTFIGWAPPTPPDARELLRRHVQEIRRILADIEQLDLGP